MMKTFYVDVRLCVMWLQRKRTKNNDQRCDRSDDGDGVGGGAGVWLRVNAFN